MLTALELKRPWNRKDTSPLLDLGAGYNRRPGAVCLDKRRTAATACDIQCDLERFPWPIKDGAFPAIIAWQLFEHLKPWLMLEIMDECWRVLKPEGLLYIGMPIPESPEFFQDPSHVRTWSTRTPENFDPDFSLYKLYRPKPWKVEVNTIYEIALPAKKSALYFVLRRRECDNRED